MLLHAKCSVAQQHLAKALPGALTLMPKTYLLVSCFLPFLFSFPAGSLGKCHVQVNRLISPNHSYNYVVDLLQSITINGE